MSIIDFPLNPTTSTVYTFGSRSWVYNGRAWQSISTFVGYTGSQGEGGPIGYTGSAAPGSINLYQGGALTVVDGVSRWYAPYNLTVVKIKARVISAADRDIILVVKKNNVSTVTITIPSAAYQSTDYTTPLSLLADDFLTVSVTQIGTGAGTGGELYVQFNYTYVSS
jgi:hypothetical protein